MVCILGLISLSRKGVVRISDCPDMATAVYLEHKATNKKTLFVMHFRASSFNFP